jgi:hypothetical protein
VSRLRRSWATLPFERKLSVVIVPIVVALIGVGAPLLTGGGGQGESRPSGPDLEVLGMSVSGGAPRGVEGANQLVDITIRNSGGIVAVVTGVGFRVRQAVRLEECGGRHGARKAAPEKEIEEEAEPLRPSWRYKVVLPPGPETGQVVEDRNVSQQIPAGKPDRFTIGFDLPVSSREVGDHLYELDVLLYHDGEAEPTELGTILVSAPYLPSREFFWSGQRSPRSAAWGGPDSAARRCLDRNEAVLAGLLESDAERSPGLSVALLSPG